MANGSNAHVRSLAGALYCSIPLNAAWQVFDLKVAIEAAAGVPRREQRLLYGVAELVDHHALAGQIPGQDCDILMLRSEDNSVYADIEFMLRIIQNDPSFFRFVAPALRGDRELVLWAVAGSGDMLQHACEELRADPEIVSVAVANRSDSFQYALGQASADRAITLVAVTSSGDMLQYACDELRADLEIVSAAVAHRGDSFQYALGQARVDRATALAAASRYGAMLCFMDMTLRLDPAIALAAVSQNGTVVQQLPERNVTKTIALAAVTQDGMALQHLPGKWRKDRAVLLAAVEQNGLALQFTGKGKRAPCGSRELVLAAVRQCGDAIAFAHPDLCDDLEVAAAVLAEVRRVRERAESGAGRDARHLLKYISKRVLDQLGGAPRAPHREPKSFRW